MPELMKSLEFLGAAGEVTGSAILWTSNSGTKGLMDCGIYQDGNKKDPRNESISNRDTSSVDLVVLSHGHLDHCGRLPHYCGGGEIFSTRPTYDITDINLHDSEKINPMLYRPGSVDEILKKFVPLQYDAPKKYDGLTITFGNPGHVLGAVITEILEKNGEKIVFSGDLGNSRSGVVTCGKQPEDADIVVMEATYGDKIHPIEDSDEIIMEGVNKIKKTGGTMIIPCFAIERTQYIINRLKGLRGNKKEDDKLKNIPVYLISPMAARVTEIYKYESNSQLLNAEVREQVDPFSFPIFEKVMTRKRSQEVAALKTPKIIIAGGGMLTGGPAVEFAMDFLSDKNSVFLFPGFCTEGTPGREILEGSKRVLLETETRSEIVDVEATLLRWRGKSGHADKEMLLEWLSNINNGQIRKKGTMIDKLFLTHSEDPVRKKFAQSVREEIGIKNIYLPKENEIFNLHSNN